MKCRICNSNIDAFMTFGKMPLGNGFITSDDFKNEYFFELKPAFCETCKAFQIVEQPDSEKMFHENYAFYSSTSSHMAAHFKSYAEMIIDRLEDIESPLIIELGSNDGIMLRHFTVQGMRHLGIEPSSNVADVARSSGLNVITAFFDSESANSILAEHGRADAIVAANVICHIPNFSDVLKNVESLLSTKGIFVFEEPYLGDMIEKGSYDQIYDEHVFIFSSMSVKSALKSHGLELIDVQHQPTHGGSMRYIAGRSGVHIPNDSVARQLDRELTIGLDKVETFEIFKRRCEKSRSSLYSLLENIKRDGKCVVGYGATSKSTTVINYCGITPDLIEFISDTTPIKQGKFSPGTHIPIRPYEAFVERKPDYSLLFAWNHRKEIFQKERNFLAQGGHWIEFVPEVAVDP